MTAPITRIFAIPKSQAREFGVSRQRAHVALMRGFPQNLGPEPRKAVNLLWRLDEATGTLRVQSTIPGEHPQRDWALIDERTVVFPTGGVAARFSLDVACEKTPSSRVPPELRLALKKARANAQAQRQEGMASHAVPGTSAPKGSYRSKKIVVPAAEREDWLVARLARNGLRAVSESISISPLRYAQLAPGRGRIPFVSTQFSALVEDAALVRTAILEGIAAGRTYGLGLLTSHIENTPPEVQEGL